MNRELSIIIPTLNEQDNILPLLEKLQNALSEIDWEVIFIDDNSRDATSDVIEEISKKDNRVHLLKRLGQRGLHIRIRCGSPRRDRPHSHRLRMGPDRNGALGPHNRHDSIRPTSNTEHAVARAGDVKIFPALGGEQEKQHFPLPPHCEAVR